MARERTAREPTARERQDSGLWRLTTATTSEYRDHLQHLYKKISDSKKTEVGRLGWTIRSQWDALELLKHAAPLCRCTQLRFEECFEHSSRLLIDLVSGEM